MVRKRHEKLELVWYIGVFVFIFVWFSQIHPLVIFDVDDWTYISGVRRAVPVWGGWNPSRVLPEILMPFCSRVAVYVLKPIIGDFITALTVMNAIVAGIFITGYVWSFSNLIKRAFSLSSGCTIFASALFLTFHFLVFRSQEVNNSYLFYCHDVTCYYNYLFPSLLNASLVMYLMHNDQFETFIASGSMVKKGAFILVVYLAIFSHLPASGILAVYAGCKVLTALVEQWKEFHFVKFVKRELLNLAILAAWLFSAVFELFGGNSKQMDQTSFLQGLKETMDGIIQMFSEFNTSFVSISVIIIVLAAVVWIMSGSSRKQSIIDNHYFSLMISCVICTIVMLIYLLVLYAKAGAWYIYRSECRFGVLFYGFLIVLISFGYVMSKYPKVVLAVPLVLCILVFEIDTVGKTFLEANPTSTDSAICADINNDLIEQIVNAQQLGQTEMELYVPISDSRDNWPLTHYMGDRISVTLYEYGVITQPMNITIVPSEAMNEKYHLPVPIPFPGLY